MIRTLSGVTWQGDAISDPSLLDDLPAELGTVLRGANGFILHGGCLHVRGACHDPLWHSLRRAWRGEWSIHALYGMPEAFGIPFAQDCVGDQFLLRDGLVWTLEAETGSLEPTGRTLPQFLESAESDPMNTLSPEPLLRHKRAGGALPPGRLLFAYPPFCTKEAASGVAIKDVPADEVLTFHAELARSIAGLAEGEQFRVTVTE